MKIIVIGASGNIGAAVVKELSKRHEVVKVGKTTGDFQCDIKDQLSIHQLYKNVGLFDALVSTVGNVHFAPFEEMTADLYQVGLQDKLMGQINLVLIGQEYIQPKGSFTLTSGVLARDPIRGSTSSAMVNGALESFALAAAIEMPNHLRINVVSPTILLESMPKLAAHFRGFRPVTAADVALAYSKSVEGLQTGQTYIVE